MTMKRHDLEVLQKRIKIFFNEKQPVHIVTKSDSWYNGYITEIYDDYFNLLDRKKDKVSLFYLDIGTCDSFTGELKSLKKPEGWE